MDRRDFVKTTAAGVAWGVSPFSILPGGTPQTDKVVMGIVGVNSRGNVLAQSFARQENAIVAFICDVDRQAMEKCILRVEKALVEASPQPGIWKPPEGVRDFREILDRSDVDAIAIAMPEHWHAPAAIMAMQAGKHVYLEKPSSHNAREVEMLVEVQRKTGRVVQIGTQQRSGPKTIQAIQEIREGIIGRPYYAKAWYSNTRGPIGTGQPAPIPEWLDYELWQGPALRRRYRDNLIHYNWHWFRNYGTGEIGNNATHELDIGRWALGVDFPVRVTSSGGRFHYRDDWEFFDTQVVGYEYDGGRSIIWEGRSCNGLPQHGRGRGTSVHGTEGSIVMDRSGYVVYGPDSKEIKRVTRGEQVDALNVQAAGSLTDLHIANFLGAIVHGERQNQPVREARKTLMMIHQGNIAQFTGRALDIDPRNGRVRDDADAMALWSRAYEPGWKPVV